MNKYTVSLPERVYKFILRLLSLDDNHVHTITLVKKDGAWAWSIVSAKLE